MLTLVICLYSLDNDDRQGFLLRSIKGIFVLSKEKAPDYSDDRIFKGHKTPPPFIYSTAGTVREGIIAHNHTHHQEGR